MSNVVPMYKFDDHIKECDYRYRKLEDHIDRIEDRLDNIERIIGQIKQQLVKN